MVATVIAWPVNKMFSGDAFAISVLVGDCCLVGFDLYGVDASIAEQTVFGGSMGINKTTLETLKSRRSKTFTSKTCVLTLLPTVLELYKNSWVSGQGVQKNAGQVQVLGQGVPETCA
jgi:hypothetical protein